MNEDVDSPAPDVPGDSPDDTETAEPNEAAPGENTSPGIVHEDPTPEREPADLDAISRDLDGVEAALDRLADGTYWIDEVTGEPIPDEVLAADPVARRADAAGAASA